MDYQTLAVRAFMEKAEQEIPAKPKIPCLEARLLRARLILEEALETINRGLGIQINIHIPLRLSEVLEMGVVEFYEMGDPDIIELADGCADLKVVTVGTEIAFGIDGEPVFNEVMRSNLTKFADGFKDGGGKWRKGPSYVPPNISPIIEEQSK